MSSSHETVVEENRWFWEGAIVESVGRQYEQYPYIYGQYFFVSLFESAVVWKRCHAAACARSTPDALLSNQAWMLLQRRCLSEMLVFVDVDVGDVTRESRSTFEWAPETLATPLVAFYLQVLKPCCIFVACDNAIISKPRGWVRTVTRARSLLLYRVLLAYRLENITSLFLLRVHFTAIFSRQALENWGTFPFYPTHPGIGLSVGWSGGR